MAAQLCSQCTAPLPLERTGELVRCTYCGTANRVGQAPAPAAPAPAQTDPRLVIVPIVLVVLVSGIGAAISWRGLAEPPRGGQQDNPRLPAAPALPASPIKPKRLLPSELATLTASGTHELDVQPPSPVAAWDVSGGISWAASIARMWRSDAVLNEVRAHGVAMDGRVDATQPNQRVVYAFLAPSELARYEELVKKQAAAVSFSLHIEIEKGVVEAALEHGAPPWHLEKNKGAKRPSDRWGFAPQGFSSCPLAKVLERGRSKGLFVRPTYEAALHFHISPPGWRIDVTDGAGQYVWVNAPDCR